MYCMYVCIHAVHFSESEAIRGHHVCNLLQPGPRPASALFRYSLEYTSTFLSFLPSFLSYSHSLIHSLTLTTYTLYILHTCIFFLAPSSGGDASSNSGLENNTIKQLFSSLFSNLQHMVKAILFMRIGWYTLT